ncbi:DNA polymerase III, subunit gamma and tau [Candidatus Woesebacteria bacterium RIFCSPLOWO2_01_FULL_39_61]|uniref:DNA polymerase III subunit gamma/tau n=1 Tax=Candidatus Woesebacteria bacterium RIFCSPHIGHO2_02_FULL_39_13 TaxID=1802505 RepID=A0A1F7Z7K3_9BACT|nr:MAG: DNA polymerase III, subunit gamma and tau [Candidatus Woesebacteria bacterium RIFCSPHIGHO2_01_FULL_39_95]OGM34888.1 MAG: DNA polymerase III, subunit gamma and tau [Candidatus Woesebacteria bacterium RIFCSPHIGHO2_02_FULL_39_13]OGM38012.1 MAG: DNA polymerase III, subunit gamma and tau [Candidatus Woesebacteria bacterium RIFCSPHIGHO2_12_FULL_40_20]OGM66628.1 MAG: DNA polymerase III, subunit gamma and tau [Candidatus Woesebacteria bacterium RIFCSPLOWO2_01_FULL_39_61]OGM73735.1 MAG: DNA poly
MTFYLKYRPQTLVDLDSTPVRESLIKIVESKSIPHAFLFSGPRGTGKTSAARILAKVVNCENPPAGGEPCNECDQCTSITKGTNMDVIELDAASHRGIDDVRALRDAVKLAPARAKKKVYIIDEAHMLTVEASNALLKTLEEPPEHVMFILATTNPEKLIDTIRSRVTNVRFSKATNQELVRSLEKVVKGEKLKAESGTLPLLAEASDGSFRDAVKLLEQVVSEGIDLTKARINEYLFKKESFDTARFCELLVEKKTKEALDEIEKAISAGITSQQLTKNIIQTLRGFLLSNLGFEGEKFERLKKDDLIQLVKLFTDAARQIPGSLVEQIPLEIAVITWCESGEKEDTDSINKSNEVKVDIKKETVVPAKKSEAKGIPPEISTNGDTNGVSQEIWLKVLSEIRPKNTSTEALLRAAKPLSFDGATLTLGVYYSFHKERLEGNPHRDLLEGTIGEILGNKVHVVCTLTDPPEKPKVSEDVVLAENEDEDIIKVAKEIFGS